MLEFPRLELGRVDALLRPHQLQLIPVALDHFCPRLWADTDPVDSRSRGQRPVGLDRNAKSARVQRVQQRRIELEHRLAAGDHYESPVPALAPQRLDLSGKRIGAGELSPTLTV